MRRARPFLLSLAAVALLGACATPPPANDPDAVAEFRQTNDPYEPMNRVFYAVNDGLDAVVLRPIALAYHYTVPAPVRTGVHNVLANISTPVLLANDLMETKPHRTRDTIVRFFINTTVGVVGFFDVASKYGYPAHEADFGLTLALWGVPQGPFLFLPVIGPSNPRDATGFGVDVALDPLTYIGRGAVVTDLDWARYGLSAVDERERVLDPIDQVKKTALDPYATFRSLYRQHRDSEIQKARDDDRAAVPPPQ